MYVPKVKRRAHLSVRDFYGHDSKHGDDDAKAEAAARKLERAKRIVPKFGNSDQLKQVMSDVATETTAGSQANGHVSAVGVTVTSPESKVCGTFAKLDLIYYSAHVSLASMLDA